MHFIIDSDSGTSIKGWLAPDNPSQVPTLIVVIPGRPEVAVKANVMRAGIRDLGLHATGQCGFDISNKIVPHLEKMDELEILEAESRLPIYSRFIKDRHVQKKLFLFECSLAPQRRLINEAKSCFSLGYSNIERNGLETTIAIITNPFTKSIFVSGRPSLTRYEHFLKEKGYIRAALLRDPFEELAERLLFLHILAKEAAAETLAEYASGVMALIDFARDLPFSDSKALTLAFRRATDVQRRELMSPMTRVFGCDIDEPPKRDNVTKALDNLAAINVVGTREKFDLFRNLLANAVGADVLGAGEPATFQSVGSLATTLSRIGLVADLLSDDLALYSYVSEAISEGLANAGVDENAEAEV